MKQTFVVDENVFIFAHKLENEREEIDESSARLISAIVKNCHALAMSTELYRRYVQKAEGLRLGSNPVLGGSVLSLINKASILNPDKMPFIPTPDLETGTVDKTVPAKDHFVVKLVLQTGALLVTTDGPLTDALQKPEIKSLYGIVPLRPEAALPYAVPN